MFKFLLTPKWIALTIAVVLLVPAFKALSDWQWDRFLMREARNNAVLLAQNQNPALFSDLAPAGNLLNQQDQWRTVSASGTFLVDQQYLVRKKSLESEAGLWVVTPFKLDSGQVITVVRGWTAAAGNATLNPELSDLVPGRYELVGRLRNITLPIKPEPNDIPQGQRIALDPVYGLSYLELIQSSPEIITPEIRTLPGPVLSEGTHRSYSIQWIIFIIMLIGGYAILFRNELVQRRKLPVV